MSTPFPDLTQRAPRSPHCQLGGYVHLPRLIDKARAFANGKNGDYHYNCPMDAHFFAFTGISADAFLAEIKLGRADSEILAFVRSKTSRLPYEIEAWSNWLRSNAPGRSEGHAWFAESLKAIGGGRDDVKGFFDLLDLDDYVSFGGKA